MITVKVMWERERKRRSYEQRTARRKSDFGTSISVPMAPIRSPFRYLHSQAKRTQRKSGKACLVRRATPCWPTAFIRKSPWNVYQEETYQLSRRRARHHVDMLCPAPEGAHQRVLFSSGKRAFEQNYAADGDRIYGDTFTIMDDQAVEGIGNNVSLEFDLMDFSEAGTSKLIVYGRSAIDKNTIHIRFANSAGESSNQLVEYANRWIRRASVRSGACERQTEGDIHLPAGKPVDFGWFRFVRSGS